jgi:hypothetical protein
MTRNGNESFAQTPNPNLPILSAKPMPSPLACHRLSELVTSKSDTSYAVHRVFPSTASHRTKLWQAVLRADAYVSFVPHAAAASFLYPDLRLFRDLSPCTAAKVLNK